jgi:ribosomal protein S6
LSLYEGMFLMDNRQANRDWEGSLEKMKSMLTKHGSEIVRCDRWGERKLAYEMDGRRRGTYVLAYFNATGQAVNEIYRECELSDMILRTLILKVEAVPPEDQMFRSDDMPVIERGRDVPAAAAPGVAEAVEEEDAAEDGKK